MVLTSTRCRRNQQQNGERIEQHHDQERHKTDGALQIVAAEQLSQISHRANLGFHALALGVDGGEPNAQIGKLRRNDLPLRQEISTRTGLLRRQVHGALGTPTPGCFLDRAVDLAGLAVEIGDYRGLVSICWATNAGASSALVRAHEAGHTEASIAVNRDAVPWCSESPSRRGDARSRYRVTCSVDRGGTCDGPVVAQKRLLGEFRLCKLGWKP